MRVLVIDVGGTNVKVLATGQRQVTLGTEVREGHLEDSTLIFHVAAPDTPGGPGEFHPRRERGDHDRHGLWLYLRHAQTEKSALLR
jgi:hypothetical protein